MPLIDDKEKFVRLFINNLLWGRITADFSTPPTSFYKQYFKIETSEPTSETYPDWVMESARSWQELKNKKELSLEEENHLEKDTDFLYDTFFLGRFRKTITGELRDKEAEEENAVLRKENAELSQENQSLKQDNIDLARELKDRQQQIRAYENQFYKKGGNQ